MACGITLRQFEAIVGGTWRQGNFGSKIQCLFEQGNVSVSMGRHQNYAGFAADAARSMRTINPAAVCTPRSGYRRVICSSTTEVSGISYRDGVLTNALALGDALRGPLSATEQRRLEVIVGKVIDA